MKHSTSGRHFPTCADCGKPSGYYLPASSKANYRCRSCWLARHPCQQKTCERCGAVYVIQAFRAEESRFCSRRCQVRTYSDRKSEEAIVHKTCPNCSKQFTVLRKMEAQRYCSASCYWQHRDSNHKRFHAGQQYGRWQTSGEPVTQPDYKGADGWFIRCRCQCGTEKLVRIEDLLSGRSRSCGCLKEELSSITQTTHGETRKGARPSSLYSRWSQMRRRCLNPKCPGWKAYGGRGISICPEWVEDYTAFRAWANDNGYAPHLTLDRIDVNGNYEPSNCRWIRADEQAANTRRNRWVEAFGERKHLSAWARDPRCLVSLQTFGCRIRAGWDGERALTTPPQRVLPLQ